MQACDIQTMPAKTGNDTPCFVAYSDTAEICVVAKTRDQAIALAVKTITAKYGAAGATVIDFNQDQGQQVNTCTRPTFTPSQN